MSIVHNKKLYFT